jgi:hypothetical protein
MARYLTRPRFESGRVMIDACVEPHKQGVPACDLLQSGPLSAECCRRAMVLEGAYLEDSQTMGPTTTGYGRMVDWMRGADVRLSTGAWAQIWSMIVADPVITHADGTVEQTEMNHLWQAAGPNGPIYPDCSGSGGPRPCNDLAHYSDQMTDLDHPTSFANGIPQGGTTVFTTADRTPYRQLLAGVLTTLITTNAHYQIDIRWNGTNNALLPPDSDFDLTPVEAYWESKEELDPTTNRKFYYSMVTCKESGMRFDGDPQMANVPLCSDVGPDRDKATVKTKWGIVPVQTPYGGTARAIPGTIQAEDYDDGGEGLAYHDTTAGNSGGLYRADNVDVQSKCGAGCYNIGYAAAGEWTEYTVDVQAAGTYTLQLNVAATSTRTMHVEVNGTDLTGAISIPNTGAYTTFQTITAPNVSLSAGQQVIRVVFDTGSINLDWFSLSANTNTYTYREAESGTGANTSPMTIVSDSSASGGQCIWSGTTGSNSSVPTNGHVTYTFSVQSAGTHKVWGRFLVGPSTASDDSLWVKMDSGSWVLWNDIYYTAGNAGYGWDSVHDDQNLDAPVTYSLSAGSHTLEIAYRETGLKMDKFLITNDLSFTPQ